jgi:P27 family predicted phage terminase small subunit
MGGTAPPPPDHLGELGRQVWLDVWEGFPSAVLNDRLDRLAVTRLAEAADDRENARMYLQELGVLLEEPIVTPRGDVVGTRMVINPAALQVQKLDRQIDLMSDRLGLSPAARARLGLTISKAQLAQADASNLLSRMRRDTSA